MGGLHALLNCPSVPSQSSDGEEHVKIFKIGHAVGNVWPCDRHTLAPMMTSANVQNQVTLSLSGVQSGGRACLAFNCPSVPSQLRQAHTSSNDIGNDDFCKCLKPGDSQTQWWPKWGAVHV